MMIHVGGDKFAEALVELVRSGAPLAATAIHWHYATWLVAYASWVLVFGGIIWFAFSLAKRIDHYCRDKHRVGRD